MGTENFTKHSRLNTREDDLTSLWQSHSFRLEIQTSSGLESETWQQAIRFLLQYFNYVGKFPGFKIQAEKEAGTILVAFKDYPEHWNLMAVYGGGIAVYLAFSLFISLPIVFLFIYILLQMFVLDLFILFFYNLPVFWWTIEGSKYLGIHLKRNRKPDGIWHEVQFDGQILGQIVRVPNPGDPGEIWHLFDSQKKNWFRCSCPISLGDDYPTYGRLLKLDQIQFELECVGTGKTIGVLSCPQPVVAPFELSFSTDQSRNLDPRLALVFAVLCIGPKSRVGEWFLYPYLLHPLARLFLPLARWMLKQLGWYRFQPMVAPWEK